jgi:hypothetical protein
LFTQPKYRVFVTYGSDIKDFWQDRIQVIHVDSLLRVGHVYRLVPGLGNNAVSIIVKSRIFIKHDSKGSRGK